jgi:hypothetical protein
MAQNQKRGARSQLLLQRQALEISAVKPSVSVPGNKTSAGSEAVAVSVVPQVASIRVAGKSRVVATPPVGFGRAVGGAPIKMRAAHITKPSTGRGVTCGPAKPGWFCGRAG